MTKKKHNYVPPPAIYTTTLVIRVDEEMLQLVDERAKKLNTTRAALIRNFIEWGLENE